MNQCILRYTFPQCGHCRGLLTWVLVDAGVGVADGGTGWGCGSVVLVSALVVAMLLSLAPASQLSTLFLKPPSLSRLKPSTTMWALIL